ncbi:hypothetical protein LEP1GSC170_3824 [Leptospira interrogans serovar Bataviae str. HAI135]|nr:hypothetical protein LEP1GSC170_3824 [Leptospira interrogans serovar Bataviae str. HAI135]
MKKRGNYYKSQDLNGNPWVGTTARLKNVGTITNHKILTVIPGSELLPD